MNKQEEFGLILCKTVQNQPRLWFYPKMNLSTVDTRSRNSVSSYEKLAVKLHFNCPKTACWLDTLPLACWWPLFRQRNSIPGILLFSRCSGCDEILLSAYSWSSYSDGFDFPHKVLFSTGIGWFPTAVSGVCQLFVPWRADQSNIAKNWPRCY